MMKKHLALGLASVVTAIALSTGPALAASTFYGIVRHISVNSIKVENPRTHQTLGFEVLPHFDRVFSGDGKTTYQMRSLRPGRYVGIVYDQRAFGMRHADKVYVLNNANQRISQP
jgi:hypothetical protein